jgi:hypothetical protein
MVKTLQANGGYATLITSPPVIEYVSCKTL